jgi:hypothetical protein
LPYLLPPNAHTVSSIPYNLDRGNGTSQLNDRKKENNVYYINGSTSVNGEFYGGAGTIFVNGDLRITGSGVRHRATSVARRTDLPSVGFIVTGNIYVDPGVTRVEGAYFTNGLFDTGSVLPDDGSNRTGNDAAFELKGLAVANNFLLRRQTSGASLAGGLAPERFNYDGRVVVNPPMYFTDLFSSPAAWNEGVPYRR